MTPKQTTIQTPPQSLRWRTTKSNKRDPLASTWTHDSRLHDARCTMHYLQKLSVKWGQTLAEAPLPYMLICVSVTIVRPSAPSPATGVVICISMTIPPAFSECLYVTIPRIFIPCASTCFCAASTASAYSSAFDFFHSSPKNFSSLPSKSANLWLIM